MILYGYFTSSQIQHQWPHKVFGPNAKLFFAKLLSLLAPTKKATKWICHINLEGTKAIGRAGLP